jgi:hypothetical protein
MKIRVIKKARRLRTPDERATDETSLGCQLAAPPAVILKFPRPVPAAAAPRSDDTAGSGPESVGAV